MRSNTQTVTIDAATKDVVAFIADVENLPRWAIGFAKAVHRQGDQWMVVTGQGDVGIRIEGHEQAGTVDFHMAPAPGVESAAFARVVPNGSGAEMVFTQFQQPGITDETFEQLVAALGHELIALKALLEVTCPL
jgi:hypothetical protein